MEFWDAIDLQKVLQYTKWKTFLKVINKAMIACKNNGFEVSNHFNKVNKAATNYKLTRCAYYFIIQNSEIPQNIKDAFTLLCIIKLAERDIERGAVYDHKDVFREIEEKHLQKFISAND